VPPVQVHSAPCLLGALPVRFPVIFVATVKWCLVNQWSVTGILKGSNEVEMWYFLSSAGPGNRSPQAQEIGVRLLNWDLAFAIALAGRKLWDLLFSAYRRDKVSNARDLSNCLTIWFHSYWRLCVEETGKQQMARQGREKGFCLINFCQ